MLTQPYDHDMIKEFDNLGRVHCSVGVDLVHMMACQGFVQDAVIGALFAYKNSGEEGQKLLLEATVLQGFEYFQLLGWSRLSINRKLHSKQCRLFKF